MYIYLYLKQKIHDLEYAINTQEKSYGNLQEENKQLLQEVYLNTYIQNNDLQDFAQNLVEKGKQLEDDYMKVCEILEEIQGK